jgi:predicted O-methyltransferase YrrM
MDVRAFLDAVRPLVRQHRAYRLRARLFRALRLSRDEDPCPDVVGMASAKKLALLSTAVSFLPVSGEECYLEVGTYQGKSLISALINNPGRCAVACDNFSLFEDDAAPKNRVALERNLARYGLSDRVRFFDRDFRDLLSAWDDERLPSVGVYFYDGAHDEESQYLAIRLAERVLAEWAVVIIDDWRFAEDSDSRAEAGTKKAISESTNEWRIEHVLPARYNGDLEQWWNGVAVLSFRRRVPSGRS